MAGPGRAFYRHAFGRRGQLCRARGLGGRCAHVGRRRRSMLKGPRLMSPRVKKAAILAVKIAILVGLLEYARRQAQIDDEIAVPEGGVAFHDEYVASGVRLKVLEAKKSVDGTPLA